MTDNYLNILKESLEKKLQIMARIQEYSRSQQEIFRDGEADLEKFDQYVDKKGKLIDELMQLDAGFETLYQDVSEQLQGNRQEYAEEIKHLQELVARVTDESVAIQAQEARNKSLVQEYFRKQREGIAQNRKNSRAVLDYYNNVNKPNTLSPQFMDSKQ